MTVAPGSGAICDEGAGKVDESEIVLREHLPADAESAKVVMPAVGALDDPATRTTGLAAPLLLAASTKMQVNTATRDLARGVVVVVAFVEAEIPWAARTPRRVERNSVEGLRGEPLVVDVGAGQRNGDGDATPVGEDVALGAKLSTICRIGSGEAPLWAPSPRRCRSREHQFQSIPRFSS